MPILQEKYIIPENSNWITLQTAYSKRNIVIFKLLIRRLVLVCAFVSIKILSITTNC